LSSSTTTFELEINLLSFGIFGNIFKESVHNFPRGVHFIMGKYGHYVKKKKAIMAREKSPNNTISIYGMAIYGKCHYYFGTPALISPILHTIH